MGPSSPPETRGRYKERRRHRGKAVCDILYRLFSERYWPIAQNDYSPFVHSDPVTRMVGMLSRETNSPVFDFVLVLDYSDRKQRTLVPAILWDDREDERGADVRQTYDQRAVRDAFERNLSRMSSLFSKGVSIVLYVFHDLDPEKEAGHSVLVYFDYKPEIMKWSAMVRDPNGAANWGETLGNVLFDLLDPILPNLDVYVPPAGQHLRNFNFSLTKRETREMFAPHKITVHVGGWCALLAFVHTADVMCSGRGRKRVLDFESSSFAREFFPTRKTSVAFMLSVVTSMLYLADEPPNPADSGRVVYWFDKRTERILRTRPEEVRERRKKASSRSAAAGETRKKLSFDHVAIGRSGVRRSPKSLLRFLFRHASPATR